MSPDAKLFPTIASSHWREMFRTHRAHPPQNPVLEAIHQLSLKAPAEPEQGELFLSLQRWKFLFDDKRPRYRLHAPDALELRWSVYDTSERRTVAYGATPAEATDNAMRVVEARLSSSL